MIDQVLQAKNLYRSHRQVVINKGSSGVDGMTVYELDDYRKEKQSEITLSILHHRYRVGTIKGVEIPKSNGKTRLLGIPTVIDRWLQQAVSRQLSAKFELDFAEESYGFRRGKNAQQAVLKSLAFINDGYQDIVDIDLKSFFDEVQHYKVLQLIYNRVKCPTTLWLIRKWLRAPILINGRLRKRRKGVPQGGPLSPLLSNILLNQLDQYLKSKGCRFTRYADDFSIYMKSKSEARKVDQEVKRYLAYYLDLPVNEAKSGIRRPVNFEVLGFGFVPIYEKGKRGIYQLVVSKSSWSNFKRKLKQATKKTLPYSFDYRLLKLKEIYRGWINYYRKANINAKLKKLDEWLRNRIRYCIWKDWKRPERKRKNLIQLGVPQGQAYAWSRTRMGGWAVAQSPILRTTITTACLKKRGYESMQDYYLTLKV